METTAVIALGSNRRHGRFGPPQRLLDAAVASLSALGVHIISRSHNYITPPMGPSERVFANAVLVTSTRLPPARLLAEMKAIERAFGRRQQRIWGARVLDLDLIAYGDAVLPSRLSWRAGRGLIVPHRSMHLRRFVLDPMLEVAPGWRHPILGRTVRQMRARLMKARSHD